MSRHNVLHSTLLVALSACSGGPTGPRTSPLQLLLVAAPAGNQDIYAMSSDGLTSQQLTNDSADDQAPRWSPDHRHIVFISFRDTLLIAGHWRHTRELYVMNADGSNPVRLTHDSIDDDSPDWSPDGQEIVFSRFAYPHWSLFLINPDGTGLTQLTNGPGDDFEPRWSPTSSQIAFLNTTTGAIRVHLTNPSATTDSTTVPLPGAYSGKNVTDLAWAPSGDRIVVSVESGSSAVNIFTIRLSDGALTQLTQDTDRENTSPAWSPDGSMIAFSTNRDNPSFDVHVMNAETGADRRPLVTTMPGVLIRDWKAPP